MDSILLSLVLRAHGDFHLHGFFAAAGAHAADRRRGQVIAPDREAAVPFAREHAVRDVHAHPAFASDPHVRPGVARSRLVVAGVDVAAHVARGSAERPGAGDETVRVILAHAAADREGVRRGAGYFGEAALVRHRAADTLRQREEVFPR